MIRFVLCAVLALMSGAASAQETRLRPAQVRECQRELVRMGRLFRQVERANGNLSNSIYRPARECMRRLLRLPEYPAASNRECQRAVAFLPQLPPDMRFWAQFAIEGARCEILTGQNRPDLT